ncbi:unnamed protein product [Sphenostylis stenocarpa]|uniref:Uncharacterized protein n=1 Tax=Sphenostylis stenocarpa TaxID=92480 RepID=A0AA86VEI0_9FABA|nr:unnamed protein product [Sphenostylis stenocarpa]
MGEYDDEPGSDNVKMVKQENLYGENRKIYVPFSQSLYILGQLYYVPTSESDFSVEVIENSGFK